MTDVGNTPAFYRTALFVCDICVLLWLLLTGCQSGTKEPQKVKELEYTVLEPLEQPEEVKKVVEERKEEPFQFVYSDGEYMYLTAGYGKQSTGGYSIAVESVYLAKEPECIVADLTFLGPDKKEKQKKADTYPYIVLKTEAREEPVAFR